MVQRNDDNIIEGEIVETVEAQQGGRPAEVISPNELQVLFAEEQREIIPASPQNTQDPAQVTLSKHRAWGERRPPQQPANPNDDSNEQQQGGRPALPISDEELGELFEEPAQPRQAQGQTQDPATVTLAKQRTWGL